MSKARAIKCIATLLLISGLSFALYWLVRWTECRAVHRASYSGDIGAVQRAIADGDVGNDLRKSLWVASTRGLTRMSALGFAIEAKHSDIVHALLSAGADPDKVNSQGMPSLVQAMRADCDPCALELVAFGASRSQSFGIEYPIHLALRLQKLKLVERMISAGGSLGQKDNASVTAFEYLMECIQGGQCGWADATIIAVVAANELRLISLSRGEHRTALEWWCHLAPKDAVVQVIAQVQPGSLDANDVARLRRITEGRADGAPLTKYISDHFSSR